MCTSGTTVGSECEARCKEGFFAAAGSGVATFTCEDKYGGAWLQQGHPFYESSLVCTKCPTIENCRVSSCATGTDAVCTECKPGYYGYRLDEAATRCLLAITTIATAGFTAGAAGIYVFTVSANTTVHAGGDSAITVPAAASLTITGTADGTSMLDVGAVSIQGTASFSGVSLSGTVISVGEGGIGSILDCVGIMSISLVQAGALRVSSAGGLTVSQTEAMEVTTGESKAASATVDLAGVVIDTLMTVESGASVSITGSSGLIKGLVLDEGAATIDSSFITMTGAIELSGEVAQLALTNKIFDGPSISVASGAGIVTVNCSGTTSGLVLDRGSGIIDSSAITMTGAIELRGDVAQLTLANKVFEAASISVTSGAGLFTTSCTGSVAGLTCADATSSLSFDRTSRYVISDAVQFSNGAVVTLTAMSFSDAQVSVNAAAIVNMAMCGGTIQGVSVQGASLSVGGGPGHTLAISGTVTHSNAISVQINRSSFASVALNLAGQSSLELASCDGSFTNAVVTSSSRLSMVGFSGTFSSMHVDLNSHISMANSSGRISGLMVNGRKDVGALGGCEGSGVCSRYNVNTCGDASCATQTDAISCTSSGSSEVCDSGGCHNIALGSTISLDSNTSAATTTSCVSRYRGPLCDIVPTTCRSYYNTQDGMRRLGSCPCNGCGSHPCGCDGRHSNGCNHGGTDPWVNKNNALCLLASAC